VRVIVNADDFGYSTDGVRATVDGIERGVITSASIMPNLAATSEALNYARGTSGFSFGVHLTLVGDWSARPIASPNELRSLVGRDGTFLPANTVRLRALLGRLPVEELEREISAQIELVASSGVSISHVDSHRHLHKYPNVRRALDRVLPRFGLSRVRTVQDVYMRKPLLSPTVWLGRRWKGELAQRFETTDHFYMPTTTGDHEWEAALVATLAHLDGNTIEVGVHPGHEEDWRSDELRAATRFSQAAGAAGYKLVGWGSLNDEPTYAETTNALGR
jgi:predicted glycoside hydrolase/deacetylase ChbG (UPF0249 family)